MDLPTFQIVSRGFLVDKLYFQLVLYTFPVDNNKNHLMSCAFPDEGHVFQDIIWTFPVVQTISLRYLVDNLSYEFILKLFPVDNTTFQLLKTLVPCIPPM